MSIIKHTVNGNEYKFINSVRGNRSGFVHETQLFKNDEFIGENKVQYYNRTWEVYQYQTVMKGAIRILQDAEFETFKNSWKYQHNVKRLTESKKVEMMQEFTDRKTALYADLQELYMRL